MGGGDGEFTKALKSDKALLRVTFETTIGLMLLLLAVMFMFGAIIQEFEAPKEASDNEVFVALMARIKQNISSDDYDTLKRFTDRDDVMGREGFTTFEDGKWVKENGYAVTSAASYAFDLCSTIGYGSYTAETDGGRGFSLLCILICFPLAVLAYTRFANLIFDGITSLLIRNNQYLDKLFEKYGHDGVLNHQEITLIFKDLDMQVPPDTVEHIMTMHDLNGDGQLDVEEFEDFAVKHKLKVGLLTREYFQIEVAVVLFFVFSIFYTVLAILILKFDFYQAFYFTLVTISTVGLGDITPVQEWRAFFSLFAFIGIGFTALLLKAVVDKLYSKTDFSSKYLSQSMELEVQRKIHQNKVEDEEEEPSSI